jgi:hypothetical protein
LVGSFDDYGQTIDHHEYMDSEQLRLEAAAKNKVDEEELEKDPTLQRDLYPTKCVVETFDVRINCKVKYIDFEGRYDGNDLMSLLRYMRPHKCPPSTELLDHCMFTFAVLARSCVFSHALRLLQCSSSMATTRPHCTFAQCANGQFVALVMFLPPAPGPNRQST